jgi:hypothetical protein
MAAEQIEVGTERITTRLGRRRVMLGGINGLRVPWVFPDQPVSFFLRQGSQYRAQRPETQSGIR